MLGYLFGVFGFISLSLASLYKNNVQIVAIALLMVSVLKLIYDKKTWGKLLIVFIAFLMCFASTKITTKYYESYANNTLGKGVPSVAYIAMGLQGNGGWIGFHSTTFMDTDYDYEKTSQISIDSIEDTFEEYKENPFHAVRFFYWKNVKQWSYETRAAYWSVNLIWNEPRSSFALSVENGKMKDIIAFVSDVRLTTIYVFILIGLLGMIRTYYDRKRESFGLIGVLTFIGGFVFLSIWEAHSSYTISFINILLPLTIPYAMPKLLDKINNKIKASKS